MRPATIFLQGICAVLGGVFCVLGALANGFGGLLIGSLFILFAAVLGTAPTTNPTGHRQNFFKWLALAAAIPLIALSVKAITQSILQHEWGNALITFVKFAIFACALAGIAFQHHPIVQRICKRLGITISSERDDKNAS